MFDLLRRRASCQSSIGWYVAGDDAVQAIAHLHPITGPLCSVPFGALVLFDLSQALQRLSDKRWSARRRLGGVLLSHVRGFPRLDQRGRKCELVFQGVIFGPENRILFLFLELALHEDAVAHSILVGRSAKLRQAAENCSISNNPSSFPEPVVPHQVLSRSPAAALLPAR